MIGDDRGPAVCMVGSSNTDLVGRVPRYPDRGQFVTGTTFHISFGGKGANQAAMAALLGARVTVVTRLGRDVFGQGYLDNYRRLAIDTTHVAFDDERASGAALILVEETTGLNTIAYLPGANGALSAADVDRARLAIEGADVVLGQLEVPVEATLRAFRIAREAPGRPPIIILNTAPIPGYPLPDEALGLADILVANEEEAAYFAGFAVDSVDQARAAVEDLAGRSRATAIVTLGGRGVVFAEHDEQARYLPVEQVAAVDTTGAGDAFVGSLAYQLAGGRPIVDAVDRAAKIATRSVLKRGAQPSFPTRAEVADILDR